MTVNALQKLLVSAQVHLSHWLTHHFTDCYDILRYDSYIHQLLSDANIPYQTYATVPWLNYCDPDRETWTVFILFNQEWRSVELANPFCDLKSCTVSDIPDCRVMNPTPQAFL